MESRTMDLFRKCGWEIDDVRRWVGPPKGRKIRKDLFGVFDLTAIGHGYVAFIQATTIAHMSERKKKVWEWDGIEKCTDAGALVLVVGFEKRFVKKRKRELWVPRIQELSRTMEDGDRVVTLSGIDRVEEYLRGPAAGTYPCEADQAV